MRLERLASDKIKIFLTFEDLLERGISKDEIWMDVPKVHDLFRDMISEASEKLGFEAEGPVIVEVFALPSQGMVIIVTISDDEDCFDDSMIELQITVNVNEKYMFEFEDLEHVIQLAKRLRIYSISQGELYSYDEKYFLSMEENASYLLDEETFVALVSEYGRPTTITTYFLREYGQIIFHKDALKLLNKYFT